MWGFIALGALLLWISYEVDRSRKIRGESGVPLLGLAFGSVKLDAQEEASSENAVVKESNSEVKTHHQSKAHHEPKAQHEPNTQHEPKAQHGPKIQRVLSPVKQQKHKHHSRQGSTNKKSHPQNSKNRKSSGKKPPTKELSMEFR